ncbi:MAG: hypothetical protein FJ009_00445 [Chloroflexi bacterium]|nr:hypothetical protein [Chloroflexota bacterium]
MPKRKPRARGANDFAHSLGFRVKCRVAENTPNKSRNLILVNGEVNQTVSGVTQIAVIEIAIAREKSDLVLLMQERNDFPVLHP